MFFDDKTACFVVKQAMDDKHREQPTVSAALIYIENVFDRLELRTSRGRRTRHHGEAER